MEGQGCSSSIFRPASEHTVRAVTQAVSEDMAERGSIWRTTIQGVLTHWPSPSPVAPSTRPTPPRSKEQEGSSILWPRPYGPRRPRGVRWYALSHEEGDHPSTVVHTILVRADSAGATHFFVGSLSQANFE